MGVSRAVAAPTAALRAASACWWPRFREECARGALVPVRCVGSRPVGRRLRAAVMVKRALCGALCVLGGGLACLPSCNIGYVEFGVWL